MSAKTGLEGTYRWIPVAQELPDDDLTVLLANNAWSGDPWCLGYLDGDDWRTMDGSRLDGKLIRGCDPHEFDAPTHWMPLPEPPQVVQEPTEKRPSDFRLAFPNNPFAVKEGITCGVEDRCRMIKSFTAMQCLDALVQADLGKVVKKALEVRLRKIAKGEAK